MNAACVHGVLLGNAPPPQAARAMAAEIGRRIYTQLEAEEFSGDLVQTWASEGVIEAGDWLPAAKLAELGLAPASRGWQLVASADCDDHVDDHGPTLLYVLVNDSVDLVFSRRRMRRPSVGALILFDDKQKHRAAATRNSKLFLALSVPLVPMSGMG